MQMSLKYVKISESNKKKYKSNKNVTVASERRLKQPKEVWAAHHYESIRYSFLIIVFLLQKGPPNPNLCLKQEG